MSVEHFDAIVIGSGAGGAAAAYKLVQAGLRTALVERGDHLPVDGSTLDIQRVVRQGEFLSREAWQDGAGRALCPEEHFNVGGKTKWYGAALLRFGAQEFRADARHGCRPWPIELQDLEPYYCEAERLLQVRQFDCEPDLRRILAQAAPPQSEWLSAPVPLGLAADITQHANEAAHFDGFASALRLKSEAETSILAPIASRSNFHLRTNTEVVELLGADGAATTIAGVRLRDGRVLRAPRTLLAGGALHSPRLLARYLSSSGLDRSLPAAQLVGRNLKLHLLTAMVAVSYRRISDLIRKTTLLTHQRHTHSSAQPLGFDAELLASLMPKFVPGFLGRLVGARAYGFFLQTEDGSDPRNCVTSSASGVPVLNFDERRLTAALLEHRAFTRSLQRALLRAGMFSVTQRIGLNGTAHVCGTLVCGRDPNESVVNAEGRVHGMRGLYVVDGSVLPRSSRVNPALTIYAWGLRVADRIAVDSKAEFSADTITQPQEIADVH
jgi:choline dehydrogenase-like flavoprotein